jgi:3-isopropylmalate dehydrogenase
MARVETGVLGGALRDSFDILLLPGDGIGPEVIEAARAVMDVAAEHFVVNLSYEQRKVGAIAIREEGEPISDETLEKAKASDAVLLGAVGHPDFDRGPIRPESGLLKLRKSLGAFANLRPVKTMPVLLGASALKREVVEGVNILIIRELTGGAYFGEKVEEDLHS